ncbi:hypothetical protein [Portibacter marinus]|uniref:hypothetical protein n=1 Tax=Portibacter marinus TaxID=2898660 RepID=UPI001F1B77B4|nr:hypothetical protein [Portibacter marinus]
MKNISSTLFYLMLLLFSGYANATNPVSHSAEVHFSGHVGQKAEVNEGKNLFKRIKRTLGGAVKKAGRYFQVMTQRGQKFLIAWIGLSIFSLVSITGGYLFAVIVATDAAILLFFLLLILGLVAAVASNVFFILWLVDIIKTDSSGTRVPGPDDEERGDRERRKRRRKRN